MAPPAPILLAAGGTGGHLFPAEALARELLARGARPVLVTDHRGKAFGDDLPQVAVERVRAGQLGGSPVARLRGLGLLALGAWDARALITRLTPAAVVGFGGYPSVPTLWAAARAGVPIVLHEQNTVLGRANRLFAGRAARIATGFASLSRIQPADRPRAVHTGNPVRPAFLPWRDRPYQPPADAQPFHLLVLGGSQGARIFGEIIPAACAQLPPDLRRRLRIVQQCRPENLEQTRAAFAAAGVTAELSHFFRDVPERLAATHLVLTRSGASTLTELAIIGRPAILVPLPSAMDDHQTANAQALVAAGGAWLAPQSALTPADLAARLRTLMADPAALAAAATAAHAQGLPAAAGHLADLVLAVAAGNGDRRTPTSSSLEAAA